MKCEDASAVCGGQSLRLANDGGMIDAARSTDSEFRE